MSKSRINDQESISASLIVQILSESGNEVFSRTLEIDLKSGVSTLFELKPDTKLWDGTYKNVIAPLDVYIWKIDAVFDDGAVWRGQERDGELYTVGTITLLR